MGERTAVTRFFLKNVTSLNSTVDQLYVVTEAEINFLVPTMAIITFLQEYIFSQVVNLINHMMY